MDIYDCLTDKGISLPKEIEKREDRLKDEYLLWVHNFGNALVDGKTVKEHLMHDGLSFWWLTLIAEKSPYKTPIIYKVFKLRTLELLLNKTRDKHLTFYSDDKELRKPISDFAKRKGIEIVWKQSKQELHHKTSLTRSLFKKLPHFFQGLGWLASRFITCRTKSNTRSENAITVVTYFPNIDLKLAEEGRFRSNYWGEIDELFDKMNLKVNWIWLYSDSQNISFSKAKQLREKFNKNSPHRFYLFEDFVSDKIGLLVDYTKMCLRARKLLRKDFFSLPNSEINFYNLYSDDWKQSLIGKTMAENMLWQDGFKNMRALLPKQKLCLYLCEMAAWEKSLLSESKKICVETIGFQHSSARKMDLRYFEHKLTYGERHSLPLPDVLAVNSELVVQNFDAAGYKSQIRLVEALRYNYLLGLKPEKNPPKQMLVFTGSSEVDCRVQLLALKGSLAKSDCNFGKILVKPHPDFSVGKLVSYLGIENYVKITNEKNLSLLAHCSLVFTSNSTSVALESLFLGLPTLLMGPVDNLNLAPISGKELFVHNSDELEKKARNPPKINLKGKVFCLDKNLPRWKKLLESSL